jgi:hypothetical protein
MGKWSAKVTQPDQTAWKEYTEAQYANAEREFVRVYVEIQDGPTPDPSRGKAAGIIFIASLLAWLAFFVGLAWWVLK